MLYSISFFSSEAGTFAPFMILRATSMIFIISSEYSSMASPCCLETSALNSAVCCAMICSMVLLYSSYFSETARYDRSKVTASLANSSFPLGVAFIFSSNAFFCFAKDFFSSQNSRSGAE